MNESAPETNVTRRGGDWLSVVSLIVLALFGLRTIGHASFWLRLASGRVIAEQGIVRGDPFTFTAADQLWINTSWLYDRVLYGLWNLGGASLIILLHVAAVVAAFALLIRPARRLAGPLGTALALLGCAWLLSVRFVVSPVLIALLFAALFIRGLSAEGKVGMMWLLLPVQVVWANIHGSFILGPIIFFLFAVDRWRRNREGQEKRPLGWLAGLVPAALLVSLLNPYGPAVYAQTFRDWTWVVFAYVQEWVSPFSLLFEYAFSVKHIVTIALLVGAIGLITEKRKLPVAETSLAVLGAFLVVRSLRHIEFFALLAFPFLALSLSAMGTYLQDKVPAKRAGRAVGTALILVLAVLSSALVLSGRFFASTGSASRPGLGVADGLFPEHAAEVLARPGFPAKTVNLVQDGSYLAWRLAGRPVFVDPRADLFGTDFFNTLMQSLNGDGEAWGRMESRWEPESVILNGCEPGAGALLRLLLDSRRWALAYFDGTSALLLRATAANQSWLTDKAIQEEGLRILEQERRHYRERVACCSRPSISPRLIGAGTFFMAMGRYPEAESVYSLLARGAPSMGGAWYGLGVAQTQQGRFKDAVASLQQACRHQARDPRSWLQLSRACAGAGMTTEAEKAFEKGKQLNPAMAEHFRPDSAATPAP